MGFTATNLYILQSRTGDSFWARGFQFCSPPEITLLSLQSRCTGGYGSAPAVPLKPFFFLSASDKCRIVSDRHNKRLRFSLSFFTTCFIGVFVFSVFIIFFRLKWPFPYLSETICLRIENLIFKNSRICLTPFLNEFVLNVTNVRFILVGGYDVANPGEGHILPGQQNFFSLLPICPQY